jgi:hypothetical protein
MSRLLCGTALAALLLLYQPAQALVIEDLGVNPVSSQGDFSNSVGGGAFADQYTFQLVGGPAFFTITSATNVFPNSTDFISDWEASVFQQVGPVGGGDDLLLFGPQDAVACPITPNCQFVAGTGILAPGNYYLELTGVGGGTSGYGGNLSVAAVPGPAIGAGIPGLLAAFGAFLGWRRLRHQS